MGVNKHRMYTEACHALANYLTGEEVQTAKITASSSSIPTNLNSLKSDEAKASSIIKAAIEQMKEGVPQVNLPSDFWWGMYVCLNKMNDTDSDNISEYYNPTTGEYNTQEMQKLLDELREAFFPNY